MHSCLSFAANVQNEPNLRARGPGLRIDDCGLRIERRRWPAGTGGQSCKTNPIWPGRRCWTERTVRNEPNLAPRLRAEHAGRGERRRSNAQNEPNLAPPRAGDGGHCAKRTQFRPVGAGVGGQMCKTKPNLGEMGCLGKGGYPRCASTEHRNARNEPNLGPRGRRLRLADAGGRRRQSAQNEPNLAIVRRRPGRLLLEAECAKRTQFGPASRSEIGQLSSRRQQISFMLRR
jgi:hypothetical protein